MLHLANLEEIQRFLLLVPGLVRALDSRDPDLPGAVKEWLEQMEATLSNNRMAVAADVAVLRGVLISAERGVIPTGLVLNGRTTARKIKDACAADVLRKAEEIISTAIKGDVARFAEGERLVQQIVAVAQRKGLIPTAPSIDRHTEMLNAIWHAMTADQDLVAATTHLTGLVGVPDNLILFDRMLRTSA